MILLDLSVLNMRFLVLIWSISTNAELFDAVWRPKPPTFQSCRKSFGNAALAGISSSFLDKYWSSCVCFPAGVRETNRCVLTWSLSPPLAYARPRASSLERWRTDWLSPKSPTSVVDVVQRYATRVDNYFVIFFCRFVENFQMLFVTMDYGNEEEKISSKL
jgi:hypothetical protein